MPNIKSAKKRVLVSQRKNTENVAKKTRVKSAVKKFNTAIAANDIALAEQLLPETMSVIDAAASDGLFHKNAAARKKATLCRALNAAKA
jgi:small subunit ribosomal protein S20